MACHEASLMQRVVATLVQASTSEYGSMRLRTAQDCGLDGETHVHCYNACNSLGINETCAICASKLSRSLWTDEHRLCCLAADQVLCQLVGVLQLCIHTRSRSTDQARSLLQSLLYDLSEPPATQAMHMRLPYSGECSKIGECSFKRCFW